MGNFINDDFVACDLVQTGEARLRVPKWKNYAYSAPCEYSCPIKIPTQKRFSLLRNGNIKMERTQIDILKIFNRKEKI